MAISLVLPSSAAAAYFLVRQGYASSYVLPFFLLAGVQYFLNAIYNFFLYPFLLSPIRHLPGPKDTTFLLGNFPEIFKHPSGQPHIEWIKIPNQGLIRYLGLMNKERIMPTTPELLKEILHQKSYIFVKPPEMLRGVAQILGPRGLLFSEGDEHRHQRKILLPAFSHGHIKNIVPIFWSTSRDLVHKISDIMSISPRGLDGKPVIEMGQWTSLATLDIIGEAGFGYHFHALEFAKLDGSESELGEGGSELANAYKTIFTQTRQARFLGLAGLVFPSWIIQNLPFQRNFDVRECRKIIQKVSLEIIHQKKSELREGKGSKDADGSEKDILSVMLRSGQYDRPEDEETLRDQMMTFLAAGHETTATALVWALYLLSQKHHQHMQSRLREEIRVAFPHGLPERVTYDKIESLKYLRQVTSEVLRFFPPVPLTMRVANVDTTLADQFIPKGTTLTLVPWAINRSRQLWGEDADEFRPERWQDDASGGIDSNYAFMTFLAGPRGCIGAQFARVEFKCLLAGIIGRYEFELQEGREKFNIKGGITARPEGGMPLKVNVVEGW